MASEGSSTMKTCQTNRLEEKKKRYTKYKGQLKTQAVLPKGQVKALKLHSLTRVDFWQHQSYPLVLPVEYVSWWWHKTLSSCHKWDNAREDARSWVHVMTDWGGPLLQVRLHRRSGVEWDGQNREEMEWGGGWMGPQKMGGFFWIAHPILTPSWDPPMWINRDLSQWFTWTHMASRDLPQEKGTNVTLP